MDGVEVDGRVLLDRIVADPTDDAAHVAYADWLVARGDPRGELIHAQRAAARGGPGSAKAARKATDLLKRHRGAWIGPLKGLVQCRFEDGFVVSCQLEREPKVPLEPALGHEAWLLVHTLDAVPVARVLPLLRQPAMGRLRTLIANAEVCAALLSTNETLPLDELSIEFVGKDEVGVVARAMDNARGLPSLRSLRVALRGPPYRRGAPLPPFLRDLANATAPDRYAWILATRLALRLRTLAVASEPSSIGARRAARAPSLRCSRTCLSASPSTPRARRA